MIVWHAVRNTVGMGTRYRYQRSSDYGMTSLEVETEEFALQLQLISEMGKRERRLIARSFFQWVKPWLKQVARVTRVSVDHAGHAAHISVKSRERQMKEIQAAPIDSPAGALGYEIRMKRLRIGRSQAELARAVGIQRSHLSAIERGLYHPHAETLNRIRSVLTGWTEEDGAVDE